VISAPIEVCVQNIPSTHAWPIDVQELRPALRLVLSLAKAERGILMLYDEPAQKLFPVLAHGLTPAELEQFGAQRCDVGPFAQALTKHRRVRVRNAWREQQSLHDAAHALGFRHLEILPFFRNDGSVLGALNLIFRNGHGSPRRATRLESHLADLVAVAVAHAQKRVAAERAQERGDRTNAAKIQFLARLSHELRTPLQSISGYVDLMRVNNNEPLTDTQTRMLSRIKESQRILLHIIDDVITFARLEEGHVSYELGMVRIGDALRAAEAVVSPLAIDRDINLIVSTRDGSTAVIADPDKLTQIIVNLSANALKFTPAGGTVTLSARTDDEHVTFEVADTGPGIAEDKLKVIFEPYVQLTPHTDRYGGSGLGLAISREFARGMEGDLVAANRESGGAVFSLRLPRRLSVTRAPSEDTGRVGP
jgi:signal transduction histidine kinase